MGKENIIGDVEKKRLQKIAKLRVKSLQRVNKYSW
jgi:hypothetical protein